MACCTTSTRWSPADKRTLSGRQIKPLASDDCGTKESLKIHKANPQLGGDVFCMKTPLLCIASILVSFSPVLAQKPESSVVPSAGVSARDGFTFGGTTVLFTREGVSQKVEKEIVLENGLRVRPDGTVTLPNGEKTALRNNQILTLHGRIEDAALTQQGIAPLTSGGAVTVLKKQGEEVGIAANDGISISGADALITRNGVSEKLTKEMRLANGTRVKPNGRVTNPDGAEFSLKTDQVLTFDGVVRDIPPRANTNVGTPDAGKSVPGSTERPIPR